MKLTMIQCGTDLAVVALLTITTFTLVGLVAIWASFARLHWFVRITVVAGVLAAGMMIPAHEIVLTFLIQTTMVLLPMMVARRCRRCGVELSQSVTPQNSRTALRRGQVSLGDVLLLTPVACALSALIAEVPREAWANWPYFVGFGVALGFFTAGAELVVFVRTTVWVRVLVLLLCLPAALIIAWLVLVRASRWAGQKTQSRRTFAWMARVAVAALSVGIVLPPAVAYCLLMTPPDVPADTLPDPNGYDNLMRAGKRLKPVVRDAETASMIELGTFVSDNRNALDSVQTALSQESRVPSQYFERECIDNLQIIRELTRALMAEGKLAEIEGRTADAVRTYLNVIRLGHVIAYGGIIIDSLFGWGVQGNGLAALYELRQGLTSEDYRDIALALESLNARREALNVVIARERAWRFRFYGWQGRLRCILGDISGETQATLAGVEERGKHHQVKMRLLICEMALRRYRLDKGSDPANLAELVPQYLSALPKDPFTEKPLVYRQTSTGYVLYSVGPDENDDHGRALDSSERGDVILGRPVQEPDSGDTNRY